MHRLSLRSRKVLLYYLESVLVDGCSTAVCHLSDQPTRIGTNIILVRMNSVQSLSSFVDLVVLGLGPSAPDALLVSRLGATFRCTCRSSVVLFFQLILSYPSIILYGHSMCSVHFSVQSLIKFQNSFAEGFLRASCCRLLDASFAVNNRPFCKNLLGLFC